MTLLCLSWETAHLQGKAWISHHHLRYRAFIERQRWNLPTYRGLEYDQFDTPAAQYIVWLDKEGDARACVRLIPTTQPYQVKLLWPDLIEGPPPQTPSIWEATRFCCDQNLDSRTRNRVVAALICGCQEFGITHQISKFLGVMPLKIFERVIAATGCKITRVGPVRRMNRHYVAAAYIDVSPEALATARNRAELTGIEHLFTGQQGPHLLEVH
jgi:N-acyl-L-homoserine lactone synthetase